MTTVEFVKKWISQQTCSGYLFNIFGYFSRWTVTHNAYVKIWVELQFFLTHLFPLHPFSTSLKTSENRKFSDIIRG